MALTDPLEKRKSILLGTWLHIRVEFSAHGTAFECEGVKIHLLGNYVVIMETFVDHRSRSMPQSMVSTTLIRTHFTNRKWKPTERNVYQRATILINGLIPEKNLLEFHFRRQPNSSLFISSDTKCFSANYKPAAFLVLTKSFLCTRTTQLNIGQVTRKCIFWLALTLPARTQFLCRKPRCQ